MLSHLSAAAQLVFVTAASLIVTALATFCVVALVAAHSPSLAHDDALELRSRLTRVLCVVAVLTITLILLAVRKLLLAPLQQLKACMHAVINGELTRSNSPSTPSREWRELHATFDAMIERLAQAKQTHEQAQRVLAQRTRTVDRLLEFSQTIQGAGLPEQVYTTLAQYLESELGLSGAAILSHQPGALPTIAPRAIRPHNLLQPGCDVADLDPAKCPCLRQNLPRHFKADAATVRCMFDQCLPDPLSQPAYCIPFSVGPSQQVVVHMLLPAQQTWTEERRQLAQTYVNSAVSALVTLHLLGEAEKQSMTDPLTGLYNRRSMEQLLQREVALSERHAQPLTLVMIDMDYFKEINDTHGHAAGDHLLKSFADLVRITLRKTDMPFRYGGDEFVIALPQTPLAQAEQVVNKLRQAFGAVDFSEAIAHLDRAPTLSIGVAQRMPAANVSTLEQLISAADQALYQAKLANRNCVRVYSPPKAA